MTLRSFIWAVVVDYFTGPTESERVMQLQARIRELEHEVRSARTIDAVRARALRERVAN